MTPVWAMAIKEWKLLLRDPGSLALLFVMPSVFILIFSLSLEGLFSSDEDEERMDVLLADLDQDEAGRRIAGALEDTGHFRMVREIDGRLLTAETLERRIRSGDHELGVVIPEGATAAARGQGEARLEVVAGPVLPGQVVLAVETTILSVAHQLAIERLQQKVEDLGDRAEAMGGEFDELANANEELLETLLELHGHLEKAASMMPPGMRPGVDLEQMKEREEELGERIEQAEERRALLGKPSKEHGKSERLSVVARSTSGRPREVRMSSVQANVPGWTIFGLFWIVQTLALSIIAERARGAYGRILVAPVSMASYLVGKAIPYACVNLVQAFLMFGIGIWILPLFGAPGLEIANVPATIVLTLGISACAIAMGMFMASMTRSALFAGSVAAVVLVIMTALGGIMVPRFIMPTFMQRLGLIVPHGWALEGYLDAVVRGHGALEVLPELGVLLAFAAGFFALALWRMRAAD